MSGNLNQPGATTDTHITLLFSHFVVPLPPVNVMCVCGNVLVIIILMMIMLINFSYKFGFFFTRHEY